MLRHAPTLIGALAIAEMFYEWHSFLLEAGGFLLTWFVLDAAVSALERTGAHVAPRPGGGATALG